MCRPAAHFGCTSNEPMSVASSRVTLVEEAQASHVSHHRTAITSAQMPLRREARRLRLSREPQASWSLPPGRPLRMCPWAAPSIEPFRYYLSTIALLPATHAATLNLACHPRTGHTSDPLTILPEANSQRW